jgi:hypothetical protein
MRGFQKGSPCRRGHEDSEWRIGPFGHEGDTLAIRRPPGQQGKPADQGTWEEWLMFGWRTVEQRNFRRRPTALSGKESGFTPLGDDRQS